MKWRRNLQHDNLNEPKWYENITKPILCWVGQPSIYDKDNIDISIIKGKRQIEVIASYHKALPSGLSDGCFFKALNGLLYSKAIPLTKKEINKIKTNLIKNLTKKETKK